MTTLIKYVQGFIRGNAVLKPFNSNYYVFNIPNVNKRVILLWRPKRNERNKIQEHPKNMLKRMK